MQKILMLPLDERPCNSAFPTMMCESCSDISLLFPPRTLLGDKKQPANTALLQEWLFEHISECDAAIISADMLVYGGIVPARLHHLSVQECLTRLNVVKKLKQYAPKLKLNMFSLTMRAPAYNSADEEPDYYAQYGRTLYEIGCYTDKAQRATLSEEESQMLCSRQAELPTAVLDDFTARRSVNSRINTACIDLVSEGVIDFLVIPLDDSAQYGWAAREQRILRERVVTQQLSDRIFQYAGADEVGSILLARAVNSVRGRTPAVYLRYSAVEAPLITPKYEDRPLGENIKWQVAAAGGYLCDTPTSADFVLMINAPTASGEHMGEADMPYAELDASYSCCRCLPEFVASLKEMAKQKPVALADAAFANGADNELMGMLIRAQLLGSLTSYAAWNTAANTVGTCIAHMMLTLGQNKPQRDFIHLRFLEDWGYMANMRKQAREWLAARGGVACLVAEEEPLAALIREGLQARADECKLPVVVESVQFPWRRLFEISMTLKAK